MEVVLGGRGDEAIAAADDGVKIVRLVGIVGESAADLANRGIDSLFDIDEHIFAAPQLGGDLAAGNQLSPVVDEKHEQLQGQALEADGNTAAAELVTAVI